MSDNSVVQSENKINGFRNKHGVLVAFKREKIENAIKKAAKDTSANKKIDFKDGDVSKIVDSVIDHLNDKKDEFYVAADDKGKRIVDADNIKELVEIVLSESNLSTILPAYKKFRKQKELIRNSIKVKRSKKSIKDLTDASMLIVESMTSKESSSWDHNKIVQHLIETVSLSEDIAVSVAKTVENQIISSGLKSISTKLIREMVNNELAEKGYKEELKDLSSYSIPKDFIENLMNAKSVENSNIVNNNTEMVNLGIAELVLKQWALDTVFTTDVKRAHENGVIYLHDLGYPDRVYCSSHSLEYLKKYGLTDLLNLNTASKPAKSASVLTGHLNTRLASMQSNYAGALGIAYVNIMYAPLLEGMDAKQLKQIAQELIFNGSQNAFSRGGQVLFQDFNIHSGVPSYLKDVPSIGPGGFYMLRKRDGTKVNLVEEIKKDKYSKNPLMELYEINGENKRLVLKEIYDVKKEEIVYDEKVRNEVVQGGEHVITYGDYGKIARDFAVALLEVWGEGDRYGRVFEFPKCDFHVSEETFKDKEQYDVFIKACELASKNGSTYFVFDRDAVTLSACCRLRTTIDDKYVLRHPESMRFCGFQNVTINIPQAAYRSSRKGQKTLDGLKKELDYAMDLAVKAHLQKKELIKDLMSAPGKPLWQIGKVSCDGKPYVDLDLSTYIIGLIGVNDAVKFMIGKELHESDEAMSLGLKIINYMFLKVKQYAEKNKLKITLEESPAESCARKLAKIDSISFKEESKGIIKGDDDAIYYTNSVHLAADAPISIVERIKKQSKFHSMVESGAIIHAFIGEEKPSVESIAKLIKNILFTTQAAQLAISPEFTYCDNCYHNMRGLKEKCDKCGSTNLIQETRIVGYFSKIKNWNKSKRYGELVARHKGYYSVERADENGKIETKFEKEHVKCKNNVCSLN
jgi:anaerobic ribonucleoside-triphosphate reductase